MIGNLLSLYRYKNDLTVRQMADQLGVSAATVSRIESGKDIDAKTLIKLINWLFGDLK
jgi:transcriptional regulator with XRE-family HTH domain